jgi:hypothetical protein
MSSKLDPNAEYRPYQVIDPRTWKARVIGITSQPLAMRLIQYISKGLQRKMAAAVNEWIIELDKQNLEPFMAELPKVKRRVYEAMMSESLPLDDFVSWDEAEQFWIKLYRESGFPLLNKAAGGLGQHGTKHSLEERAKIAEGVKRARANKKAGPLHVNKDRLAKQIKSKKK